VTAIRIFRPRFFTRFLAHYLFVLVVSALLGFTMYYVSVHVVSNYSKETNLAMLKQSQKMIDRRVQIAQFTGLQVARDPNIKFIASLEKPVIGPDMYQLWDKWKKFSASQMDNQFITHSFVYFNNSDVLISPFSIYPRQQYFYDGLFRYSDLSQQQWIDFLTERRYDNAIIPSRPVYYNGNTENMIAFLQSFPLGGIGKNKGTSIVLIKERDFYEHMESLHMGDGAWAYILDNRGQVIMSFPGKQGALPDLAELGIGQQEGPVEGYTEQNWHGAKLVISYVTSPSSGLTYISALPAAIVMAKVGMIKQASIAAMIVFLLLGTGLAYYLALRNSKPLSEVFKVVGDQAVSSKDVPGKENYELLRGNINRLINSNHTLRQNIAQQQVLLTEAYWYRLLYGELNDLQNLKALTSGDGFPFAASGVVVGIIGVQAHRLQFSEEVRDELNIIKELAKNVLQEQSRSYFIGYDADKFIWVLDLDPETEKDYMRFVRERMEKVNAVVEAGSGLMMYAAVGQVCHQLLNVSRSFEEARSALEYRKFHQESLVFGYADIPVSSQAYYYPLDLELRLFNLSKLGDYERLAKLLDDLWEQNFAKRQLSIEMTRQLLHEMHGTLIKTNDQLSIGEQAVDESPLLATSADELIMLYSPEELLVMIKDAYKMLCSLAVRQEEQQNSARIADIKRCMMAQYADANLSLISLAEQFNCTDKYLSMYFKEQTGENFSAYLERIRMAKACELLKNSDSSIEHIAAQVGYNSGHAFRRAFKRAVGVSPSSYQNMGERD